MLMTQFSKPYPVMIKILDFDADFHKITNQTLQLAKYFDSGKILTYF